VLRLAQRKEREGGGHTWRIRSSPAKRWAKTGQMAPPLGPVVAAREESEERVREKGKARSEERPWAAEP